MLGIKLFLIRALITKNKDNNNNNNNNDNNKNNKITTINTKITVCHCTVAPIAIIQSVIAADSGK